MQDPGGWELGGVQLRKGKEVHVSALEQSTCTVRFHLGMGGRGGAPRVAGRQGSLLEAGAPQSRIQHVCFPSSTPPRQLPAPPDLPAEIWSLGFAPGSSRCSRTELGAFQTRIKHSWL